MDQANETQLRRCCCGELCKLAHCNSEHFDRLLLILSSVLLAISFTFTRNSVSGQSLAVPAVLLTAWILFAVTILLTLVSFRLGHCAIEAHLAHAAQCHTEHQECIPAKRNIAAIVRRGVEGLLSMTFLAGVILWLFFAAFNVL
jgi:hypothetical protein